MMTFYATVQRYFDRMAEMFIMMCAVAVVGGAIFKHLLGITYDGQSYHEEWPNLRVDLTMRSYPGPESTLLGQNLRFGELLSNWTVNETQIFEILCAQYRHNQHAIVDLFPHEYGEAYMACPVFQLRLYFVNETIGSWLDTHCRKRMGYANRQFLFHRMWNSVLQCRSTWNHSID